MMGRYVNNEKVSFDQKIECIGSDLSCHFCVPETKNAFVLVA